MRDLRLALSLAFFVPAFTLLGYSTGHGFWPTVVLMGLVGLFFGLVFGGVRGKWLDVFYPVVRGPERKRRAERGRRWNGRPAEALTDRSTTASRHPTEGE